MRRAFIGALCAISLLATSRPAFAQDTSSPKDRPPPGITPTAATLRQLLAAHDAAVGRLEQRSASVRTELWQFTVAGEQGTEQLVRRGADFHSIIKTGPFTEEYGQSGDVRWHMNENGVVSNSSRTDLHSFEMFRVLEDASDPKNDVKLLGETEVPTAAYVVEVRIPGIKHPERIFFDKRTALIIRTEHIVGSDRLVSSYDDYQTVRGLTEPSHVHDSNGTSSLDADYRRQSLTLSNSAAVTEFNRPATRADFMQIEQPINLDARVVYGTVVVRLTVNGRGLDFELSSGDRHSYIDSDVARELNLPAFGHATQVNGSPVPYETEIDAAISGGLLLKHFALEALPFHYHASYDTKVVGTLGYDFLSGALFQVDYVNRRVTATPNTEVPVDTSEMSVLPVQFDDGLPFVSGTIASHETKNLLLDSSFLNSYVLGSFAQHYPEAVVGARSGKIHRMVPFADNASYGRDLEVWLASVPDILIGTQRYLNYQMYATNVPVALYGRPVDAVIGTQFLIFYDVAYDYAHNRVLLKQNDYFRKAFKVGR